MSPLRVIHARPSAAMWRLFLKHERRALGAFLLNQRELAGSVRDLDAELVAFAG